MLTVEFTQTFLNVVLSLFVLSMLKLKFGTTDFGKALCFITGTAN